MEQYWIYVIVGVIVFVIAAAIGWYYISKNQNKYLRQELFDGEAYCVVIDRLRNNSSMLGKRKM
jgi:Na+/alanine symporter